MTRRRRPSAPAACGCACDPQLMGRLQGTQDMILDQIKTQGETIRGIDARLRTQENRGAIAGAVGGLFMALGVNLAAWWIKGKS